MQIKGKDLVMAIIEHDLLDTVMFEDARKIGLYTLSEAAEKFDVGVETVKAWILTGKLIALNIKDTTLIKLPDKK